MQDFEPGIHFDTTNIDRIHCLWLAETLMSGRFRRVLEIGCFQGYSTQAFLHAAAQGKVGEVHLCDPNPQPRLFDKISGLENVTLNEVKSVDLLSKDCDWDLVFIDGDHSLENCRKEAQLLLDAKVPAIFAHDTCAIGEWVPGADEGPSLIRARFVNANYFNFEDAKTRQSMWTERGMFWAARDGEVFSIGIDAWVKVGDM